ncbi:MAG: hypothetical protein ABI440_02100 [Casimicrobiaceae bacterium]
MVALACTPAQADTDYTDHWSGGTTQGGWGVALTQGANLIYVEIFHYDSGHNPVWFGGTVYKVTDGHYSGALYTVSGDYYGHTPYDPTLFHAAAVGTMDFIASDPSHALLTYSINGITILAPIERLTLDSIALAGNYLGTVVQGLSADCNSDANASTDYVSAQILVSQTASPGTVTFELRDTVSPFETLCTISGAATQSGKVLDIPIAKYSCGGVTFTSLHVYDIRRTANNGIEGRWKTVAGDSCVETSRFVGVSQ